MPKYFSIGPALVSITDVILNIEELPPPKPMMTSGLKALAAARLAATTNAVRFHFREVI